ncbi:hypothetical protein AXK56_09215 [Tsukamurella pulmonis]|uniref:Uncharacterized protein n=1 Tax=Tsukamurella pulmonis TaxID=47312 RepID=A0A1H1BMK8_9ACTN|nr:hypothetical protein [Tsukamurella pulmonis]KXO90276.1 hypothetical protein AXK56_09215 [Tsukamurella pulmonis]SDQ53177.1 hypothetical protein SAMN04489765_0768 [Tsukamurella pulmonis]SUP24882.1 Uncharacterised protein [Tsukamurella pulmonis]
MSNNGFGKYLNGEQTEAQRQQSHGYRRGFGQHVDGTRTAENFKREQLATQRRARIRAAIDAGTVEYEGQEHGSRNGAPRDPLHDQPNAIEAEWRREFGGGAK